MTELLDEILDSTPTHSDLLFEARIRGCLARSWLSAELYESRDKVVISIRSPNIRARERFEKQLKAQGIDDHPKAQRIVELFKTGGAVLFELPMTKERVWAKIRREVLRELAVRFDNWGRCEIPGCRDTFGLSLAHRMKRRKMPSFKKDREAYEAELRICAYLCGQHHRELEHGPPEVMYERITEIVGDR